MFKIFLILLQIGYSHASGLFFAPQNLFPEFLKSPHQVRQENKQRTRELEKYITNSDLRTNQKELEATEQELIELKNNPYAMPDEPYEVPHHFNNRWTVPGMLLAPGSGSSDPSPHKGGDNPLENNAAGFDSPTNTSEPERPFLRSFEWCAGFFPIGDLRAEIERRSADKIFFQEHEVGLIFLRVLMALQHVHGDIKSENIKKADMFSMGVLLYELLELQPPRPMSARVSDEMKVIVELLLSKDPSARPDCAQVLNMPLFRFWMSSLLENVSSLQEHAAATQILESIRTRRSLSAPFRPFEGVVFKHDSKAGVWRKRYLRLSLDAEGNHEIALTVNKQALPETGVCSRLSNWVDAFSVPARYAQSLSPNSFAVMTPDGKKLFFVAETPQARDAWVQAIKAAFK